MGAAFTFIKEGSRDISAGAEDGTLRANEWWSNAACAGVCELSCRLHVNQRRPDVSLSSRDMSDLKLWFANVASSLFRLNTQSTWSVVVLRPESFFCLFTFCFSPPPLHTGFHLSLAGCLQASILFMGSILFFGWCRMPVCAPIPPPTSLAKLHLQFNRDKLKDYCCLLHSLFMFAPISSHFRGGL